MSKSNQWFKSYGHFTVEVDFDYWWRFSGEGLRLQPAQQASLSIIVILNSFILFWHNRSIPWELKFKLLCGCSQEKFWRPSGLQPNPLVSLAIRPLRSLSGVHLRVDQVSGLHSSNQGNLQLPQVLLLEPGRDIKQRISSTSHFQHLSVTSSQVRFVALYVAVFSSICNMLSLC